jgi:Sulfotransferase domain
MASFFRRTWRRLRYGEPVVVVSGLPRSGTSMAMKMLEAGGLATHTDGLRTADDDNPKGYFEHERVKDLANEADKSWIGAARGRAIKVISYLLKELPASYNYRVVFLRRDLQEVLASQGKMLANRGEAPPEDDGRMTEIFQDHLWKAQYLLRSAPQFEVLYIDYQAVVANPRAEALRINAFLGNRLDLEKMVAAVDASLYRNRRPPAGEVNL